ncbi:MAG: hypothetical protein ACI9ZM_003207 [Paracoccaceae bacterium]|jgi:hypothetical protein
MNHNANAVGIHLLKHALSFVQLAAIHRWMRFVHTA